MKNRALDDVTSNTLIFFQIMARQTKPAKLKFHRKMTAEEKRLKSCVQSSMSDVINRLHHLEGEDRGALLFEWMEYLLLDWDDIEVDWFEKEE